MQHTPGSVSIQFLTGPEQGRTCPISKPCTAIGREPLQNDIIPTDLTISRSHAQILCTNGAVTIKNVSLNDNNLTVNRQQIRSNQQHTLNDGDVVAIGQNTTFRISIRPMSSANMPPVSPSDGQNMQPPSQPQPPQSSIYNKTERASLSGISAVASMPSFEISTNTHSSKQICQLPLNKQAISIGHDASCDIRIDEPIVSSQHLQIVRENNRLVIIHPHSARQQTTNGLYYQGRHYKGSEPFRKPLAAGDVFRIGNEYGTLVTLTYNDGSGKIHEQLPPLRPIPLSAPAITIGRGPDNMVVLQHPQVSAHHARLVQNQGTYNIVDLGSTNHIYVNGQRITSQRLNVGDEIRIGPYKLIFNNTQLTQYDESKSIRIDAIGLKKLGNNQKILINDISISIPPGKFVALVGGSGAGKSTLMDALNGLRPATEGGHVFYNGQDYYNSLASFRTQIGYVPQADIVHNDLTVEKALYYAARLRLPDDYTETQISQRVTEVLADVDMAHRRNLLVSKLSGGQRKRVSIALELLAKPSVFFLDEPTSGLDPGLDRKMMLLLRKLADQGHTIVLVTHATNNIKGNCDYVCFLCQDGRLAYFGPPEEALSYFNLSDFADIYSALEPSVTDPDIPKRAEANFKRSQQYQQYVVEPLAARPALRTTNLPSPTPVGDTELKRGNPIKQFSLLSRRYIELLKNDKINLAILLSQAPLIGLILMGLIKFVLPKDIFTTSTILDYTGGGVNAEKTLFIMAFAAIMFGCINSAREIVKEDAIYRRERAVNLGIVPYLFSKFVVLGVLCLLQSAILVIMVNLVSPLTGGIFLPAFLEIYITMALTSLNGLMIGLTLSALAPNNDRAISFVPIILLPQVIFSGILFKLDGIAQFLAAFFAARWAMIGMGSTIGLIPCYVGSDSFSFQGTVETRTPTCPPGSSTNVISQATAMSHLLLTWLILALMIVAFACATAYFLKKKDVKMK